MADQATLTRDTHAVTLRDGERVIMRPIRPLDAGRLNPYLQGLSAESRRNRYFVAINELPANELRRISHMDAPGELALMATTQDGSTMIAEAIQVMAPGSVRCEFALSVAEAWRGRGLGTLLLQNIECRARRHGARYLLSDVLRANMAMKGLARKQGFAIQVPFTDATQVEIVKDLSVPQRGRPCEEQFTTHTPVAA
jgi:acetyltransferase